MPRRSRRSLLGALAGCLTIVCLATVPAWAAAETYGELAPRISKLGKGTFKPGETTTVFGIDPLASAPGAMYVAEERGEEDGKFRLQQLGEKGEALGEAKFSARCPEGAGKACGEAEVEDVIEGPALDTVGGERRVYILGTLERASGASVDAGKVAAGTLYAFSTKVEEVGKEKVLPPIPGATEGVLADFETLKAESAGQGEALLEPTGIAVDPVTHDVIVAGWVDEGEGTGKEHGPHLALQQITDTGQIGARYVDPERESFDTAFNSPVVTPTGQILMESEHSQIVQIPPSFSSNEAPTVVFSLDLGDLEFGEDSEHGGRLALEPEGDSKGRIYAGAEVLLKGANSDNDALLTLSYEVLDEKVQVKEVGWIGGASTAGAGKCALGFAGEFEPLVAAGRSGEHRVFALEQGREVYEPAVVAFGPGGSTSGCPQAKASEPVITLEGHAQSAVDTGTKVEISAPLENGNSLEAEWEFGDETAPVTVNALGEEEAIVEHAYAEVGELELKAKITTDDLADPVVTTSRKVKVNASAPAAKFTSNEVTEGEATSFNAETSTDPNGEALEYSWEFGDGQKGGPSSSPKIEHKYAKAGTYDVTLTVKDHHEKDTVTHPAKVKEVAKTTPPTTTTTPPPTTTSTSTTVTPPPGGDGSGEVLAYGPDAKLASASATVSKSGAVSVKIVCPAGQSCAGTVTLQSDGAVAAAAKKSVLTLASGSFSAAAGQTKTITLHLSSAAMKLLRKSHVLKAKVTVAAHDPAGAKHTTVQILTLRAAKR